MREKKKKDHSVPYTLIVEPKAYITIVEDVSATSENFSSWTSSIVLLTRVMVSPIVDSGVTVLLGLRRVLSRRREIGVS